MHSSGKHHLVLPTAAVYLKYAVLPFENFTTGNYHLITNI